MHFTLKQIHRVALISTITASLLTVVAVVMSGRSARAVQETTQRRYQSYLLADELRQSSDDLTRLARTYVVDGNPKWEKQYFEILDIRNGKAPRPEHYERIYWDFRAADVVPPGAFTEPVALLDLMKRQGFTEAELSKLAQAKANSDGLVRTETVAMNMVKGQYDDGNGGFTRQAPPDLEHARAMMHDLAYHQNKAKIMKPVDEFLAMLDRRTADEVSSAQVAQSRWSSVAVALASVLACLVVLCLTTLRRRTIVVFEEVGTAADAMARGDLCFVLARDRSGDEGRLRTALEAMRVRLCDLVGAIRAGAVSVASASDEIAQGNADLSQRTEEQAGNLQQTAASMLHLSGAVKNAADSASLADQLARNAASTAARGGQMVGDVVDTMQHISTSSRKIADIIGVVDGIAFQTNLLALNAAVEAARAGEQGRGFAVVAGEVRNLAGRSAAAAKEIKSLISLSVSRVELGTQQVDAAGAAMREIVTEVQRVSEMIEGLSRAGKEQAVGIGQIDDAVQELDRVTQQNASLVEESAAAAESLQNQAATLAEAVSVFRVNDDAALSPLGAPHLA